MFDFIELVTSSRQLIERALAEDDDFAKIENDRGGNNDSILQQNTYSSANENSYYTESAPFFSKTAEAELYLLATNFLLCTFTIFLIWVPVLRFAFWPCYCIALHCIALYCIVLYCMVGDLSDPPAPKHH
jgi:hypothetical protein